MYELACVARVPQAAGAPQLFEVGPIVAPQITWTQELSRPGSLAFSCQADTLPAEVRARFADLLANPTEVWLYRDGQLVMAGYVAGYQVQGPTVTVTAPGLLGYLAYMHVDADLIYAGVDQTLIGKGLVDQWQALPYGHYGIDTSGILASGVTRDRTYLAAEQHQVLQRLTELGAADNGFDVTVDPDSRHLQLADAGTDLSAAVVLDGRNITDAGVVVSVAPGTIASEAFGLGGDREDAAVTSRRTNLALRQTWGRAAVAGTFDGVTAQTTLDGHTQALLDSRDQALFLPGPGLNPVADADVDDFTVGDTVTYAYDAGLGLQEGAFRVATKQVTVDQNGAETMAVGFA